MLKFHFASSAIFDPQRETNLYLLSCVPLFNQLSLYKRYINNNGKVKKELVTCNKSIIFSSSIKGTNLTICWQLISELSEQCQISLHGL